MRSTIRLSSYVSSPRIRVPWVGYVDQFQSTAHRRSRAMDSTYARPHPYHARSDAVQCVHTRHTQDKVVDFPACTLRTSFRTPPYVNYDLSFPPCFPPSHLTDVVLDSQPRVNSQFSQKKQDGPRWRCRRKGIRLTHPQEKFFDMCNCYQHYRSMHMSMWKHYCPPLDGK